MNNLVKLDTSLILKELVPVLKSHEKVEGAFLFGSILGQCRANSDIDVGIILTPENSYSEKNVELILADINEGLSPVNKHHFDLVVLNHTSAIFAYKVINQGRLIYGRNHDLITDFMEIVSRKRAENYPRYRQALESICRGV